MTGKSPLVEARATIIRPKRPFDPTIFGPRWKTWRGPADGDGLEGKEERDERSFALLELDFSQTVIETCLRKGESYTDGEERHCRLKAERADDIRLDPAFALAYRDEPEKYPDALKGKAAFWDGLVLRSPDGDRCAVYSYWGRGVELDYYWLDLDRIADYPSVLLASKHLALPA